MERPLTDTAIVLAGASGGLGTAIGAALVDRGASLTLVGRDQQRMDGCGLPGPSVAGDIADTEVCERAVAACIDHFGRLDGVVNAAGVVAFGPLAELDDEALDELVATNLLGPLRLIRAALPHLEGGFIANLSAVVAEQPPAGMAAYAATKAALTAADTALRRELRRSKIDVIDLRPPHTETGLAHRPIAGEAPKLPTGLAAEDVARRTVDAIVAGERDVPSDQFSVNDS